MNRTSFTIILLTFSLYLSAQTAGQYSWRYYTTGNTGIMGDYAEALWIDHDGDPYIAAYTPGWDNGANIAILFIFSIFALFCHPGVFPIGLSLL
jgi:hypothetical protein